MSDHMREICEAVGVEYVVNNIATNLFAAEIRATASGLTVEYVREELLYKHPESNPGQG